MQRSNSPLRQLVIVSPGDMYGRLKIVKEAAFRRSPHGKIRMVECECTCGNVVTVQLYSLRHGGTASCGCLSREKASLHAKNMTEQILARNPIVVGSRWGRLTVLEAVQLLDEAHARCNPFARCICDCGTEKTIRFWNLRYGKATSCGCYARETTGTRRRTHGRTETPEYKAWVGMLARCYTESDSAYAIYGGRGIEVFPAWRESFAAFFADVGERPGKDYSLDRIKVGENYEPGNVRWAPALTQQNNKRNNIVIEYEGCSQTAAQWAKEIGIKSDVIIRRYHDEMRPDKILFVGNLRNYKQPAERFLPVATEPAAPGALEESVLLDNEPGNENGQPGGEPADIPLDYRHRKETVTVSHGDVYGRLTIVKEVAWRCTPNGKIRMVECECACGNTVTTRLNALRTGATLSCGCLSKEKAKLQVARIAEQRRAENPIIVGSVFGRLTILERLQVAGSSCARCICECGVETTVLFCSLRNGNTVSCGCYALEKRLASRRTHGSSKTPEYGAWLGMIARCHNEASPDYAYYGARGIEVHPGWRKSFEAFIAHVGTRPNKTYSLDRIKVNENYEPGNVRWTDTTTQANNKRNNIVIEYRGRSQSAANWAKETQLSPELIVRRYHKNMLPDKILFVGHLRDYNRPTIGQ